MQEAGVGTEHTCREEPLACHTCHSSHEGEEDRSDWEDSLEELQRLQVGSNQDETRNELVAQELLWRGILHPWEEGHGPEVDNHGIT